MGKSKEGGGCAWRGAELRGYRISSLGEKNRKERKEREKKNEGRKERKEERKERERRRKEEEGNRSSVVQC